MSKIYAKIEEKLAIFTSKNVKNSQILDPRRPQIYKKPQFAILSR